ncbi:MAG: hypothetical protein LUE99_07040 [Bacteroides sp.]|nr:hypothetical protein [Bacteroides sp.]
MAQVNIKTTTQLKGCNSVKVTYGEAENTNAPTSSFDATNGNVKTALTIANVVNKVDNTVVPVEGIPEAFHTFYVFAQRPARTYQYGDSLV